MTKKEMSEAVLAAKKAKGLTWAKLAQDVGLGEVWLASCGHGENCLDPESGRETGGPARSRCRRAGLRWSSRRSKVGAWTSPSRPIR